MSKPYHHGDLRQALAVAAEHIVREQGVDRVSIRGIARTAGVSHAAPYHHFEDLDDLLATVAASGFTRLRSAMLDRASTTPDTESLGRLQAAGVAYVVFAAENPNLYRLMFSGRLRDHRTHPELADASDAAFATLGELLPDAADEEGPTIDNARSDRAERAAWALVHGLAMLIIDGRLDVDSDDPGLVEAAAREVTTVLGRGLGWPH